MCVEGVGVRDVGGRVSLEAGRPVRKRLQLSSWAASGSDHSGCREVEASGQIQDMF